MAVQLIVNADDFGFSRAVNAAVARAHRDGILTSASLMVTGDAADEAVEIARELPGLAVGLHITLGQGSPARTALACYLSGAAREQMTSEIEAQFERFAATGLVLSHVDGHQHLHALGPVLPSVVELALRYGARGIRVPSDPVWSHLRHDKSRLGYTLLAAIGQAYLSRAVRRHMRGTSLTTCDRVIGTFASGRMREEYVISALRGVSAGSVEVYFHPMEANGGPYDPLGPNPGDLDALLSPTLKQFLLENDLRLTTYAGLRGRAPEAIRERA